MNLEWSKLTSSPLKNLKKIRNRVLVYNPTSSYEFSYDIINFLHLKGLGLSKQQEKSHWNSLSHTYDPQNEWSTYADAELLDCYSLYYILED